MENLGTTYLALADALETEIEGLGAGSRVASENELAVVHGVSRITARSALQELEHRHVVRRLRGSGTFVALQIPYAIRATTGPSWSAIVRAAGHEPSFLIDTVATLRANAVVADRLGIRRGRSVVRVERLGFVDGDVASHHGHGRPSEAVSGAKRFAAELDLHRSITSTLAVAYGINTERARSSAELRPVDAEVGVRLQLQGRPPAWRIDSINVDSARRRPIESSQAWLRADCFRVYLEFERSNAGATGELRP